MQATHIHCFEAAGLGKAPFRYTGVEYQDVSYGQRVIGTVGGATVTTKPGGTCAFCGTYIVNMFGVESADGNRFHVGCECIRKTDDAGLIRKLDEDVRRMERAKRLAKKLAKQAATEAYCVDILATRLPALHALPHPTPARAAQGETLAMWARWMFDNRYFETLANTLRHKLA